MKNLLLHTLVTCALGLIATPAGAATADKYEKLKKRADESGATAPVKPPPASIDPKNRPEEWRKLKPTRVGDPPRIPPVFWHNPVIYHDDYVYARGWVTHILGGRGGKWAVGGDGDVCFNLALDEPYLGLRNNSNHEGEVHVEISAYRHNVSDPYTGEMKETVSTSVETIYKALGVFPATSGLKGKEQKEERNRQLKVFADKIMGKYVEVMGVWVVDIAHDPDHPWREIHPCVRVRILDPPAGKKPPHQTSKGGPREDDDEDEEAGERSKKIRK